MRAALENGDKVYQSQMHHLNCIKHSSNQQSSLYIEARMLRADLSLADEYQKFPLDAATLSPTKNCLIWMRKDPPVDQAYIKTCQLLRLSDIPVINNPESLLFCDEKLMTLKYHDLIPQTQITQQISKIEDAVKSQGQLILKPIGAKAGEGILLLRDDDKNLTSLLEMATHNGQRKVILQEYLPAISEGDKRIILLAGKPIAAVMRLPSSGEHRANMAAGGSVAKTEITQRELDICQVIEPELLRLGLSLVGIDVIGGMLTEINITSPTCLVEIAQLNDIDPAKQIIDWSYCYVA